MSNCNCHKETFRDGSGRLTRYFSALDPSYAPIDNRSLKELLVFIQQYATRIRFYDIPDSKPEGGIPTEQLTWEGFFKNDLAIIGASVAMTDVSSIREKYNIARSLLESAPDAAKLAGLFSVALSVAFKIDGWHSLSNPSFPLFQDLDLIIHSVLSDELRRIISYDEGYTLLNPTKPLGLDYGILENNQLWKTDTPIAADASIFEGNSNEEKLLNAALYADEIFNSFINALKNLTDHSAQYLHFAISEYPQHQPQMALLIAFLQLFQLAENELNGITGRMLDFYYRDVLQLTAKEPIPDKVHIIFELAKNIAEYDIPKDTLLKAGKDDSGVEQIYSTAQDLVVNRAKVMELKNIFIKKEITSNNTIIQSIYANPVANSADGHGGDFTQAENARWETFGRIPEPGIIQDRICNLIGQIDRENPFRNYAMPGFAIASPQLVLGGGNRMVMLTSDGIGGLISQFELQQNDNPLTIWLTGENGWISVNKRITDDQFKGIANGNFNNISAMSEPVYTYKYSEKTGMGILFVFLPVATDGVIPYNEQLHAGYHYKTSKPVMQVMLNPEFQLSEIIYNSLSISSFSIAVQVGTINSDNLKTEQMDGLKKLILQNDDQKIPEGKAFNPFTFLPGTGKSFYIGSEEVFNKPVTQLSINIRSTVDFSNRMVNLFLLKDKQWIPLLVNSDKSKFSYYDLTKNVIEYYLQIHETPNLDRHPVNSFSTLDSSIRKGFLRLDNQTLSSAGEIPEILTPQELASRFEIKEVSLNYTAQLQNLEDGIDQFFHVYPFGVAEIKLNLNDPALTKSTGIRETAGTSAVSLMTANKATFNYRTVKMFSGLRQKSPSDYIDAAGRLLPQFTYRNNNTPSDNSQIADLKKNKADGAPAITGHGNSIPKIRIKGNPNNQYSGNIQEEGLLCIGLSDLLPLQSVSMLFQFAEGSAGDEDNDPPPIHWSYLSKNQWHPMPGENLISDGTYGFQTTGIIKLSIPGDATSDNTIITPGLYWLQASVTGNADRIPMLISIVTQAVEAVFQNNHNSDNHFGQALAAGSVSKLKEPVSPISKVIQPFASFDGKRKETGKEFYARVSERLRHKHRAITPWDYEHLILERFPSVYKVKCITHTDPNCLCRKKTMTDNSTDCCGPQTAPGHILLIPIADLKNRNGVNPLQPKTSRRVLTDIVNYLKPLASPFVKIYAKNPVYEQVMVIFNVKFFTGTDIGFYLKKLNDEIVRYLTPWAFEEDAPIVFGQKIYASSIINFIEERPYVDFITDFEMLVCRNPCCPPTEDTRTIPDRTPEEIISSFHGCNDVESFLNTSMANAGEIVAYPSTSRSILVSAPRHIINPYVAPEILSPCEQRKVTNASLNPTPDTITNASSETSTTKANDEVNPTAGKTTITKDTKFAGTPNATTKMPAVAKDSATEKTIIKEKKIIKKKNAPPVLKTIPKKKTDKTG